MTKVDDPPHGDILQYVKASSEEEREDEDEEKVMRKQIFQDSEIKMDETTQHSTTCEDQGAVQGDEQVGEIVDNEDDDGPKGFMTLVKNLPNKRNNSSALQVIHSNILKLNSNLLYFYHTYKPSSNPWKEVGNLVLRGMKTHVQNHLLNKVGGSRVFFFCFVLFCFVLFCFVFF